MARTRFPAAEAARALMLAALLAGCDGSGEGDTLLLRYQNDLAEALGTSEPQPSDPINIGAFPERRERLHDIPETRDGMLNIYALRECQITSLVAERNNQLGRVAQPSQYWIYELELWRRLHACWHSEVPEALSDVSRERLEWLTRTKTEQLPLVSWNSLFDSDEWTGSFARASAPLDPAETDPVGNQLEAIEWLRDATLNQFSQDWRHDSSTLEGHLDTLRRRPLTAEILRALLLAEQRLGEANMLLEASLSDPEICHRLEASGTELQAAFAVEPAIAWLDSLDGMASRWLIAIEELLESHASPPQAFAEYRNRWLSLDNPDAPLPSFRDAHDEHLRHWQALTQRCP